MQLLPAAAALAVLVPATIAFDSCTGWKPDYCRSTTASNDSTTIPRKFGVVLFDSYELLDVFGPLEALFGLSAKYHIDLHLLSQTMDPITVRPKSGPRNPYHSSFYPMVLPTDTLKNAPKDLDVLMVPGGFGTGIGALNPALNETIQYIADVYPSLGSLMTVCTGALLASEAGVLDGKRATTNKQTWNATTATNDNVDWVHNARWVVDGNTWTSSGVSAGIDAMLGFIECHYGPEVAKDITTGMEYIWNSDPSKDPFA